MARAADIQDLEKMLNDGEGDEDLCDRAVEIFERLRDEERRFRYFVNSPERKRVEDETKDFVHVIDEINERRHEHALDKFKEYLKQQPD